MPMSKVLEYARTGRIGMGRAKAVLIAVVVLLLAPMAQPVGADVTDQCAGYGEQRISLEAQDWWFPEGGQVGNDDGHLHTQTCFPYMQTLTSESVTFDLTLKVHQIRTPGLRGEIHVIDFRGMNVKGQNVLVDRFKKGTIGGSSWLTCPNSTDCSVTVRVTVDLWDSPRCPGTTPCGFADDGLKQLRVMARQEVVNTATGKTVDVMRAIIRAPFILDLPDRTNTQNYYLSEIESSGWVLPVGYADVAYVDRFPTQPFDGTSAWTFRLKVEADFCSRHCLMRQLPVEGYSVHIDPDVHAGSFGITIADVDWGDPGQKLTSTQQITIPQEVLQSLADGFHKLMLRVKQPADEAGCCTGAKNATNQGILVLPFQKVATSPG